VPSLVPPKASATSAAPGEILTLLDGSSLSNGNSPSAVVVTQQAFPNGSRTYTYTGETDGFEQLLIAGNIVYNSSFSNSVLIEDCTVKFERGLGIGVHALNTRVVGCEIEKASQVGIHAGGGMVPGYPWLGQGSPPHALEIANCTLDQAGGFDTPGSMTASIEIAVAIGHSAWNVPTYSSARDVIEFTWVHDNVIQSAPRAGIFVANVGGPSDAALRILDNQFISCGDDGNQIEERRYAIAVKTCGTGSVTGNTFVDCPNPIYNPNSPNVIVGP